MKKTRKLNSRGGFTLAETLLAVLILLMVSVIVATGVPVAKNAYEKVVIAANAQVLLSTAVNTLRDELGTAWDVEVVEEGKTELKTTKIKYFCADTGARAEIYLNAEKDNTVYRTRFAPQTADMVALGISVATDQDGPLVSPQASTERLRVKYDSVTMAGDVVTFEGLKVYLEGREDEDALADLGKVDDSEKVNELRIRVVPKPASGAPAGDSGLGT